MKSLKIGFATLVAIFSLAACGAKTVSPAAPQPISKPAIEAQAPVPDTAPAPVAAQTPVSDEAKVPAPVGAFGALDACKFLTKEIAETVVGPIVYEPKAEGVAAGASMCSYMGNDSKFVSLLVEKMSDSDFDKALEDSKGISKVDPVQVRGLGDRAYWIGGTFNFMVIMKGGNSVMVNVIGVKGDSQTIVKDVSEKVLANM